MAQAPEEPPKAQAADPQTAAVLRCLAMPPEVKFFPAAETIKSAEARVVVSLRERKLRLYDGPELALETPIAVGRVSSPTPDGEFVLAEKTGELRQVGYGHLRSPEGTILLRGIFQKFDPVPPGAVFDSVTPRYGLRLSGAGPLLFPGEATGAATTDGSIVFPDKLAQFFYDVLVPGSRIIIEH